MLWTVLILIAIGGWIAAAIRMQWRRRRALSICNSCTLKAECSKKENGQPIDCPSSEKTNASVRTE